MNIAHFKKRLLDREAKLAGDIARSEAEARGSSETEVLDQMDQVTSSENKAILFEESTIEWKELQQVRDALQRISAGTYGKCIDCGKQIEPARLEAVPWTPYCLADQSKHDRTPTP